jgi:anti-sigma-K factor RskA
VSRFDGRRLDCEHTLDAGAWVLRALPDDEAAVFAEHLDGCAFCQAEVTELQAVVDALPMAAPVTAPPPELRDRIMRTVNAEAELLQASGAEADAPAQAAPIASRPGRRRVPGFLQPGWGLALTCCVLLAIGVGIGALVESGGGSSSRTVQANVTGAARGAKVSLETVGDRATLHVTGLRSPGQGRTYQVWLIHGKGAPVPTHTLFDVPRDGRARVQIDSPVAKATQVLVSDEPQGGSQAPTTAPIISAVAS